MTEVPEQIARLRALRIEQNELWELDPDDPPRPAVEAAQIADAVAAHELPPDYRAFLEVCDGWEELRWGWTFHGCGDLAAAQENAAVVFDDTDTPAEQAELALVVGTSQNDAGLLYYDRASRRPDGSMDLVEWLYDERERYPGLAAFLEEELRYIADGNSRQREAREATRAEWTTAWRCADDAALRAELARRLAVAPELPPPLTAERIAALPRVEGPPLHAAALVDPASGARVSLVLVVALRGAPTPEEMYALLGAFHRHVPVPAPAFAKRPGEWSSEPFGAWSADDPVLAAAVAGPGKSGQLGVTVTLGADPSGRAAEGGPSFAIYAPGPDEPRRAAYVGATLPVTTDPAAVRALALDIAELQPFVSGYASYSGVASGDAAVAAVYRWARRCMALDAQDLRIELRALRHAVKGAGWLTLVGAPVADALRDRFGDGALRFESPGIAVTARRHGLVIEAGALGLGDLAGGFPADLAEVDRRLAPLRLTLGNDETLSIGGHLYRAHYDAYDGPLGEGDGSYEWLERFIRPEIWLGPTPRERANALLAALPGGADHLAAQHPPHFGELLRLLVQASHGRSGTDAGLAALAFAARLSGRTQPSALANLLHGLLQRGELDRGAELVDLAISLGSEKPLLLHNAACILARRGDAARAIELVRSAKELDYDAWRSMYTDDDLASLRGQAAFEALFAEA